MSPHTHLQQHPSSLRAAPPLEPPPEKRLKASTNPAPTPYPKHFTPSLLSLPDELISRIFSFLNASDTTGLFERPRHAFALAITNSRFLRIFGTHLRRIVPDLHVQDDLFDTLTLGHMLSAIKIAGSSLRELNFPRSCLSLFKQLPKFCPRLDTIYFQDYPNDGWDAPVSNPLVNIMKIPVRSLSIQWASSRTLRYIYYCVKPEELSLIDVQASDDLLTVLKALLRNLPRKLHLHFRTEKALSNSFREYLREICPQVEDVSLKHPYESVNEGESEDDDDDDEIWPIISRLEKLLRKRRGDERSVCRKMTLEGDVYEFLKYAHTETHVEITRRGQTFIDSGDGIYPTRILLSGEYLDQDLSRLTDIVVKGEENFSPKWYDVLSGIRLKRFRVEGEFTIPLSCIMMQADVIEVSSKFLTDVGEDIAEW